MLNETGGNSKLIIRGADWSASGSLAGEAQSANEHCAGFQFKGTRNFYSRLKRTLTASEPLALQSAPSARIWRRTLFEIEPLTVDIDKITWREA